MFPLFYFRRLGEEILPAALKKESGAKALSMAALHGNSV